MIDMLDKLQAIPDKEIGLIIFKYHKFPKSWMISGDWRGGIKLDPAIDKELARVSRNDMYGAISINPDIDFNNCDGETKARVQCELKSVLSESKSSVKRGDKVLNLFPEAGDSSIISEAGYIPVELK